MQLRRRRTGSAIITQSIRFHIHNSQYNDIIVTIFLFYSENENESELVESVNNIIINGMIVIFLDIANTCMYIILQKISKKITVDKIKLTLIFMHTVLLLYT